LTAPQYGRALPKAKKKVERGNCETNQIKQSGNESEEVTNENPFFKKDERKGGRIVGPNRSHDEDGKRWKCPLVSKLWNRRSAGVRSVREGGRSGGKGGPAG